MASTMPWGGDGSLPSPPPPHTHTFPSSIRAVVSEFCMEFQATYRRHVPFIVVYFPLGQELPRTIEVNLQHLAILNGRDCALSLQILPRGASRRHCRRLLEPPL